MEDEPNKPRPVQPATTERVRDRTDDIRIKREEARKIISRLLREKMQPGDANALANSICDGIVAAMPSPDRPALRNWRMIGEYPPDGTRSQVARGARALVLQDTDNNLAIEVWKLIYKFGTSVPDDIVA